ncbi:MAG: class IIb bacteriocin, lactobin A/cerein 7B family [Prolixibacteraceae bacterium]|jgi:lactobin A/cerein 7B family class IIb bacteriocin|nr:class IIb bacteriocin, lactobin A/cerein 7B family [Prolixibacteraceae bacterium]
MNELHIFLDKSNLVVLSDEELSVTNGGVIPWGLIGRVGLRILVGTAGIATGAAIAIGTGLLAYEIYQALSD